MDLIETINLSQAKIDERREEYIEDLSNNKSKYFRYGYNNVINFARDFASAPENPISNKTPLQLKKALKEFIIKQFISFIRIFKELLMFLINHFNSYVILRFHFVHIKNLLVMLL